MDTPTELDTSSVISINFGRSDVASLAESVDVPFETAMDRVEGWASSISDQAVQLINEQLASVIEHDQP